MRWGREQSEAMRDIVRHLVASGRLDFVNGGWVQNDEAASHYVGMIDQTTRGHRWDPTSGDSSGGSMGTCLGWICARDHNLGCT